MKLSTMTLGRNLQHASAPELLLPADQVLQAETAGLPQPADHEAQEGGEFSLTVEQAEG